MTRSTAPDPPSPTAEQYLCARTRLGMKLGLDAMRALVEALGHPERIWPALLVAGTNGKGSVVAYVDAVLRSSGLRVGRYTSPHLVHVHERIAVEGEPITGPELEESIGRVRRAADALVAAGRLADHPTYFEALTAAAFDRFRARRVDAAVLEVGLGARLDATNVCEPVASAIVSVDFDHEVHLGTSLAAIASEKAGVLRPGRVTVLGRLPPEAHEAVAREAASVGARLVHAAEGSEVREEKEGVAVRTPAGLYRGLHPLPGAHQRDNLLVALRLLEAAREAGLRVDPATVAPGIASTRWPGRLQEVPGDPPLLLDGAHNPAGARALAAALSGRGPLVLLFGTMADKDVAALAHILFPLAQSVVLTQVAEARAADPDEIAARAGALAGGAHRESDPRRALAKARALATPGGTVVVAGSLYLVGEVLKQLETEPRA